MRVAVIGAGIAGLGAAWAAARRHVVTVYEAEHRIGGHCNTVSVWSGDNQVGVDTGFIVYNEVNYPLLTRLFADLGVDTEPSNMSFAVSIDGGAIEYGGNALGLFAQPRNVLRRNFQQMLLDVLRFNREARLLLATNPSWRDSTLAEFLRERRYSSAFAQWYLLPMAAAIWSSTLQDINSYPVLSVVRFFKNHGLLQLTGRPKWRTVTGGSRRYVDRLVRSFHDRIRPGCAVTGVERRHDGVCLHDAGGDAAVFDQVVFATHADQTLRLLGSGATEAERRVLGAFRYTANRAVLHQDARLMPRRHAAWASWNYLADSRTRATKTSSVTYWMNRLQNLTTVEPMLVTINPPIEPAPRLTHAEFVYHHPQLDAAALTAQRQLAALQGVQRSWFCGSYCGYGFHEDALDAGLRVAAALGAPPPWATSSDAGRSPAAPSAWPEAVAAE